MSRAQSGPLGLARLDGMAGAALRIDGGAANPLTAREVMVLRLAAQGRTEHETAQALRLSRRTIQYHLASAVEKLGAPNKTAAVARAVGHGLIHRPMDETLARAHVAR